MRGVATLSLSAARKVKKKKQLGRKKRRIFFRVSLNLMCGFHIWENWDFLWEGFLSVLLTVNYSIQIGDLIAMWNSSNPRICVEIVFSERVDIVDF